MRSFGCIKSVLNGSEYDASKLPHKLINIPTKYNLSGLPSIKDQGSRPICVSVSLSDMISWKMKLYNKKYNFSESIFYDNDPTASAAGMQPKTAFDILMNRGSQLVDMSFKLYAKVGSVNIAKECIINNGPLMICLPVRSYEDEFWKGGSIIGGHAVLLTGYDQYGFTLRNSWGTSFGQGGYICLPYEDFYNAFECWTLVC